MCGMCMRVYVFKMQIALCFVWFYVHLVATQVYCIHWEIIRLWFTYNEAFKIAFKPKITNFEVSFNTNHIIKFNLHLKTWFGCTVFFHHILRLRFLLVTFWIGFGISVQLYCHLKLPKSIIFGIKFTHFRSEFRLEL